MQVGGARSYVLGDDARFTSLAQERRARLSRRYRHGPDIDAAIVHAVQTAVGGMEVGTGAVVQVRAGAGTLARLIAVRLGLPVVAVDRNVTQVADAHGRGLAAIAAELHALPLRRATVRCVVADRALRRRIDVARGLVEIRRVLHADGALVAVVRSNTRDGHELDALMGVPRRPRADALDADAGAGILARHFAHVDQRALDYTLEFPDGQAAAAYVATLPGRRTLAARLAVIERALRLTYGVQMLVARGPHAG